MTKLLETYSNLEYVIEYSNPAGVATGNRMVESVGEFFEKKGAVELFCVIEPGGSQFKDLNEALPISHQTLTVRLKQAKKVGLLTQDIAGGGPYRQYMPTERGMEVYHEAHRRTLPERYRELRQLEEQFERETEAFAHYISSIESQLESYSDSFGPDE